MVLHQVIGQQTGPGTQEHNYPAYIPLDQPCATRALRWPEALALRVVCMAHSHSVSQFRRHLPQHWNSIMLPPHCGQIRLMIDEIMVEFGSPGIVSIILMVVLL